MAKTWLKLTHCHVQAETAHYTTLCTLILSETLALNKSFTYLLT